MRVNYSNNFIVAFSMLPSYFCIALLVSRFNLVLSFIIYISIVYFSDLIYNKMVLQRISGGGGKAFSYWTFTLLQWLIFTLLAYVIYRFGQNDTDLSARV